MRYAWMLTLPKERGDVRTLLIVWVRYQTRIRVRIFLAVTECFNHKRKKKRFWSWLINLSWLFDMETFGELCLLWPFCLSWPAWSSLMIITWSNIDHALTTHTSICVPSYWCICVLILLYMCPHTAVYVSSYCYICVLILMYMCPHTAVHVSSYCYTCVLILMYLCPHTCQDSRLVLLFHGRSFPLALM